MPRLRWNRLLSLALVSAMPLGALAVGCTSSNTSTVGQHITCTDTGTGVTNCHSTPAGTAGSGSDTCEDIDDDGDGTPHDTGEDHHGGTTGTTTGTTGTGTTTGTTAGSAGDDDDGDGIPNERDCDKRHGGDDDDSAENDGSGSGG